MSSVRIVHWLLVTVSTVLGDGEANTAGNTDYGVDGTSDDADQQTSSATNDCKQSGITADVCDGETDEQTDRWMPINAVCDPPAPTRQSRATQKYWNNLYGTPSQPAEMCTLIWKTYLDYKKQRCTDNRPILGIGRFADNRQYFLNWQHPLQLVFCLCQPIHR